MASSDENIWTAAGDGHLDAVRSFISGGVAVNAQDEFGYSAMHAAASYRNSDVLRYLLSVGGSATLRDTEGDTPLHVCEDATCGQLLLDAGADLQAVNNEGQTPIQVAASESRHEMVDWLRSVYAARGLTAPSVTLGSGDDDDDDDAAEGAGAGGGGEDDDDEDLDA